jgi:signal transduction histidine kinase
MRISSKIIFLTAALLGFLGGNAFLSWQEMSRINNEFNEIVDQDLTLMQIEETLNDSQLRKEIIFEKLTSSAEELAFANINESRRQYLIDYVKGLQEQFEEFGSHVNRQLEKGSNWPDSTGILPSLFKKTQNTVSLYNQKVQAIFKAVTSGGYQLSMEDLDAVQMQQKELANEIGSIGGQLNLKVEGTVASVHAIQKRSQRILWVSLSLSFLFAFILAWAIIQRIHGSLKLLLKGVGALQQGQLGSHVTVSSSDEIGELARSFNRMSDQLKEAKENMERKNVELNSNLIITREQKKELEKINRDLDRFVHLISHDIYGPITAIIGYADYLQKQKDALDPKGQQVVSNLKQVIGRLNAMVLDLVEMTRITRDQKPFEKVDVNAVVKEVLERQQFNIQKTNANISYAQDFPVLMADRVKLTIVFFNLIGNAIKYSSKEGHKPQIEITCQKRGQDCLFCIKDNGIGIPAAHYQDIFDMFKRLPEAEGFEGSGVGLAIVKEIVSDHGGQIWVESTPASGSCFFFTIPLES